MARVKVGLESLGKVDDGLTAIIFNRELEKVVSDCMDRPGDTAARTVTLTVTVVPQEVNGTCETVLMDMKVGSKIPSPRTKQYQVATKKTARGGELFANPASLDDARQRTLDEERGGGDRS